MKANYFLGNQTFEVRETEIPRIGPTDVLVRVAACGVCGTDVHIYHGSKGSAEVTPPVVLGHEFSGVVVDTESSGHNSEYNQWFRKRPDLIEKYCTHGTGWFDIF